jgi:hypothetical protein
MAAIITPIFLPNISPQQYSIEESNLISSFQINTSLNEDSYIEYYVFDINNNILSSTLNFTSFTVQNDGQSVGSNGSLSKIIIDPEKDLIDYGFSDGEYISFYNFLNKKIGSNFEQLYISEISSDRKEIRLNSTSLTAYDIISATEDFIIERESSPYFLDFYLNFGDNKLSIANNIILDDENPNSPTILIKLYQPLLEEFNINSLLWVVTSVEEPRIYKVTFPYVPITFTGDITKSLLPNFNLNLKDQVNNSSLELSYTNLLLTSVTSSANQLNSLLEEKEIDINVDYTNFSNFIHFSSAQTRLENFYSKIKLIEEYTSNISILNTITTSPVTINESILNYENKINSIITNFDGYDYYLYYETGSKSWPKTSTFLPYTLANSTSDQVLSWLGTTNPSSPFYGGQILSASLYDNDNQNNLYYTIPEYLREDPANDPYQLFIEMVGQHYDNIWIYYKDVTQKYNADNRLENGISKDIVADAIRDFGIKLYQNNFSNEDLYTAFLGLTPEGGLFPFPNITGSLPTPSGYEYIDTKISASNDYLPLDDVNKSLYKRIYHNLPYLLQTKGTLPGLRALITSYGIPDTILRIKEYGGKDKVNTNDWDYWQNEFNYAYKQNGDNFISSSFVLNSSWGANSDNPETVMFRFKTNGLPTSSIPYSQSLFTTSTSLISPGYPIISLRYTGSAYATGSYSGSIIDPYYQYAYLDFYPYTNPAVPPPTASVYLPFFDGEWWSVMVKRTGTGASTNFELYAGNKMYEGGENGTSIGFIASSSIIGNDAAFIASQEALFGYGISVGLNTYNSFSGSFQEIRYYNKPISESVFKDYIMNPSSIEGNSLNSGADQLAFRLPLGGELYTGSNSIHPKITGSWLTTSSFASNSTASFDSTPTFVPNTEYFYYDQPIAGIKNAIADKIRVENNVIPEGDVLSPFMSLSQQANISQSYTANTNLLEVAFSPQDEVNDDINSSLGFFNIGEYIGDPRLRSSSAEFYPDLNALRDSYFQKYTKNYNLVDFVRLIKFFDNSLFKMIKDFVPARTSLASGIIVKQHILERNKVPQPQVDTQSTIAYYSGSQYNTPFTFQDISVSGTLLPQWNDYNEGTVENPNGGTAGVFEMFNGTAFAPSGSNIFNLTQSWSELIPTISGSVNVIHNSQDEFYNGEFEGSTLTITTQSLNTPYSLNISSLVYNVSGSGAQFFTSILTPPQGRINWIGSTYISSLYVSYLYINETSLDGINISTALSNLESGDTITFTVSGSVDDGPFQGQPFEATTEGTITSIIPTNPSVWRLNLSTDPNLLATVYNIQYPEDFVLYPELYPSSSVYLDPFINDISNFYNSDDNALLNSVNDQRESTFALDVDYSNGITPVNFALLITGSATPATVPDSNYTSKKSTILKYEGSKSTSQLLNTWSPPGTIGGGYEDTGTYGKLPTVESLKTYIAYCDWIGGWPPEKENASAMNVIYLIKADGTVVIPNTSKDSLSIMQQTFQTGERVIINTKNINVSPLDPYRTVIRGGSHIEPILYTQYGSLPGATWNTTASFTDIVTDSSGAIGNYQALYNKNFDTPSSYLSPNTITQVLFNNIDYGNTFFSGNGYQVPLSAIIDGVTIFISSEIKLIISGDAGSSATVYFYIYKNGFPLEIDFYGDGNFYPIEAVYGFYLDGESGATVYRTETISLEAYVLNSSLTANDIFTAHVKYEFNYNSYDAAITSIGVRFIFTNYLKIDQYPVFTAPVTSSGYNSIWGYGNKTTYPYIITSSNTTLVQLYGNPNVKAKDISGSGFNPIQSPWKINYGDEFKFEGREDWSYMVKNIYAPAESGSGRIFQTGSIEVHFNANLPVSASSSVFNLDHFLIRRYVDDAAQNVITGFKPPGSEGPYLVKPEFVVPELNKNIDEVILDLTQKGLIT